MAKPVERELTWLLRHGARQRRLPMDAAGWVAIEDACAMLGIGEARLRELVEADGKQRMELDGHRLRACQGHSLDGVPVTLDALEASWRRLEGDRLPATLWHGTQVEAARLIARSGLLPQARTHVHLAPSIESHVGKRHGTPVLLGVASAALAEAGLGCFAAPNGVVLVRRVPASAVREVQVRASRKRKDPSALTAELRAAFGLD